MANPFGTDGSQDRASSSANRSCLSPDIFTEAHGDRYCEFLRTNQISYGSKSVEAIDARISSSSNEEDEDLEVGLLLSRASFEH